MARTANELTGVTGNQSLTDPDGRQIVVVTDSSGNVSDFGDTSTSTAANDTVSIGAASATIKAANATRRSILIQNVHASNILYVGQGTVTTANAIRLNPGESIEIVGYTGAITGIASGASTDVRYLEVG